MHARGDAILPYSCSPYNWVNPASLPAAARNKYMVDVRRWLGYGEKKNSR